MKKLFLLLAVVGMIFTACQSGGDVEEDNGGTPFVPEITISPKDLTFSCNGGEQAVDITANFEYEVVERASWVTVEQTDEGLLVIVDANKNTSERSAFISITNSQYDINKTVEVWQEGFVPKIELVQQSVEVEFEPAEYEVGVTSPYSWEATTKNNWIVVESETGIAGEEKLKFTTLRNEEEQERKGTITLKNTDYNLVAELYVTQKAFVPAITIEPETLTFAVESGTQEIAITANFEYAYSANADWLTLDKSENGISVTVPNYVEVEERTAEIPISSEKYGFLQKINVSQGAFVPEWKNIEPEVLNFEYTGGSQEVAISANFEYTYTADVDWISFEKTTNGINVTAQHSTAFEKRTAEITISSEKYGLSKTISVSQEAVSPDAANIVLYTSSDGNVVKPNETNVFGANIVSNTYKNGQGIIVFDAPVTSIGDRTFYNCSGLTSVAIPNGVTSIGDYAFYGCSSLTSVTIPDSVTSIGDYAFLECSSLTSVTIPDSVTLIGSYAFHGCYFEVSVFVNNSSLDAEQNDYWGAVIADTIQDDGLVIKGNCVIDCKTNATSVTIPDNVTSIKERAFSSCRIMTSITIPDSVTSIGSDAFYNCSSLTRVDISDLSAWCKIEFDDYDANPLYYAKKLYLDNNEITELLIPSDVTEIKHYAFYNCSSLKSVTIPGSVTSIGEYAFYNCSSLTSVTIPNSVTTIGYEAFKYCRSLTSVYCKPKTPPSGADGMFTDNASGRKIYVPTASVDAYKSASYWSGYKSSIVAYDFQ